MAVPTWKRNESNAQFLYELYKLNITIAEIMGNQPQKHKDSYCIEIIRAAIQAMRYAQTANSVFFEENTATAAKYKFRYEYFIKALGAVDNVATISEIYLEMLRKTGTIKSEKVNSQERRIGEACSKCHNLIHGVIKSDKGIYQKVVKKTN